MDNPNDLNKKNIVKLAHMYFHDGQWDKALIEYGKILDFDPDDVNTNNTMGDIHLKRNSIQFAYEYFNKAASGFLSAGQTDRSLLTYKKIIKLDTSKLSDEARKRINFVQNYVRVDEFLKEERFEPAIELLGKFLKSNPDDPMFQVELKELDDQIAELPASVQQYQVLGDSFFKNEMFEKAREMFEKISGMEPKNFSVRANLAEIYIKQGSESEAKKEYLSLAEQALDKGDLDQAAEFSRKALDLKSVEAHYIYGLIYFKRGKWAEAKVEFEKLLRIKVNHLGAIIHLAKSLDHLGEIEKAKEFFQKALNADKADIQIQETWIDFCVKNNDKETALPNLSILLDKAVEDNRAERVVKFSRMMIQLDPDLVSPRAKLIEALKTLGDLNGATDACCALALLHEQHKHFHEATKWLEKALVLSPDHAEDLEKALADMRQKELGIQTGSSLDFRGEKSIVLESSDFAEALHYFKPETQKAFVEPKVQHLQEPMPVKNPFEAQLTTASLCIEQGLLKAAIDIYQQILEVNPGLTEVRLKLTDVNDIYLKSTLDLKVKEAGQNTPLIFPSPHAEKKINTN